eukprot:TRINITY_DN12890_c0_g1_i1.p1 TRINITY_DN12890_c0_g1~~TRINITY_DN12890_c0_g1_i1.p1  ORF type:complete len:159 (-),score=16.71 TRINITY_DN12890_c0_g1_i1:43-519(-)
MEPLEREGTLTTTIDCLPVELRVYVLSFCSPSDLARVARINQGWNGSAKDRDLWHGMYLRHFPYSPYLLPVYDKSSERAWPEEYKQAVLTHKQWAAGIPTSTLTHTHASGGGLLHIASPTPLLSFSQLPSFVTCVRGAETVVDRRLAVGSWQGSSLGL